MTSHKHHFYWVRDWSGDSSIPGGTVDCSHYKCKCGHLANEEESQLAADYAEGMEEDAAIAKTEMLKEMHNETR